MIDPIAFFITWNTYGTWLTPDESGNPSLTRRVTIRPGMAGCDRSGGRRGRVASHFRLGFRRMDKFVTRASCLTPQQLKPIHGI